MLSLMTMVAAQADPFRPCEAPARIDMPRVLADPSHTERMRTALDRYTAQTMRYLECVERVAEREATPEAEATARQLKQARIAEHKAVVLEWNAAYGAQLGLGAGAGNAR